MKSEYNNLYNRFILITQNIKINPKMGYKR
jgi:hypothetical protein